MYSSAECQDGDLLVSAVESMGMSELEVKIQVEVLKASSQSVWILDLPAFGSHLRFVYHSVQ